MKHYRTILSIILLLTFGYILIGELVLPANTPKSGLVCDTLPGDQWVEIKEDGTRVPFEVPGWADGEIVLETTLPKKFNPDYTALSFRGVDMDIYIDGKLRERLATEDYPLFGDQSAECFVMTSIHPEDAGKKLRVRYEYNEGMVYQVYIGTRFGILTMLFKEYGLELFVGLGILFLGVICMVASILYRLIQKQYLEMEHLSVGVVIGACWVLGNSIFRQLYTRNLSVMSDIPFLMVMIMPLPFLFFINSLQKGRYAKLLSIACVIEILNYVVCVTLFVLGRLPLVKSFNSSSLCAVVSILIIFYTIVQDFRAHRIRSYRYVAIGFFILAIASVVQIGAYLYAHNGIFSGLYMAFGLFGFLICSIIHTIKQLIGFRLEANELAHLNKAKDDFLANMSHEIRTPINGILGLDEMIIRDTGESRIKKYALEIKSAGNTLLSIVNDILDLSKIESGNFEIVGSRYDVASVLNDVMNMTRPRALDKGLSYIFEVDEDIPSGLFGDEIRIRQIMLNVINNAVKYTNEGSVAVRVGTCQPKEEDQTTLMIKVTDTGIGIRDEDKEKLFESFRRFDEKKNRSVEGTGLGLHITYLLVDMMNGRIDCESEYGKGSTFTIAVPQRIVNADPIGDFSRAAERFLSNIETDEVSLLAPDARVLAVDDNQMNLHVIEGLLRDTRVKLDLAASGEECIKLASENTYDCILLDQMMPGMTGEATLKIMREKGIQGDTPVIVLTADAIIGARQSYLEKGFTDYLSKPVRYETLEQMLKRYLPKELQTAPAEDRKLPVLLIWGSSPEKLRAEKDRLAGVYRCACAFGEKARDKYLAKHEPDAVMHVED